MIKITNVKGKFVVTDTDYPKNKGYTSQGKSDALRFAEILAQISGLNFNDRFDLMFDLNRQLYPAKRRRVKKKPNK